jgi:hypothetical protein
MVTPHRNTSSQDRGQIGRNAIFGLELVEKLGELRIRGIFVFADASFLSFWRIQSQRGGEYGDLAGISRIAMRGRSLSHQNMS